VGLGLAILAFALWATARLQIGASFSVQPKAKVLVTHGIYSRIRNPIYIFGMVWIVGLILAIGEPWLLLIVLVLAPMQVVRAKKKPAFWKRNLATNTELTSAARGSELCVIGLSPNPNCCV